ncbi:MAG: DUF4352 domain-containing protein [Armatimonadetes bacterium]|nr:DUF4352 domain-containing protein [Armatimonadota bacterium]
MAALFSFVEAAPRQLAARIYLGDKLVGYRALVVNRVAYIPVEAVHNPLGGKVGWDPLTHAVSVNGRPLGATPHYSGGVIYVPASAVARVLGLKASWHARSRAVVFTHPSRVAPRPSPTPPVVVRPSPTPSASATPSPGAWRVPFTPVAGGDGVFQIHVTDLVELNQVRGYYTPGSGNKFVQVNLSQQNTSNELQIYTGKFTLEDEQNRTYDSVENLSNFWLVILRPGGINFGYLIYVVGQDAQPRSITLHTQNRAPLTVPLKR